MKAAPLRAHSGVAAPLGASVPSFGILSGLLTNMSSLTHFLILRIPETAQAQPFPPETVVINNSWGRGEGRGGGELCQSLVTREMRNWPGTPKTLPGMLRDWGRKVCLRRHQAWKENIQEWKPKDTGLSPMVVSNSLGDPG